MHRLDASAPHRLSQLVIDCIKFHNGLFHLFNDEMN